MKFSKRYLPLLIMLIILVGVGSGWIFYLLQKHSNSPNIRFKFKPYLDDWICDSASRSKITESTKKEAKEKLVALEKVWQEQGPKFLMKTVEIVEKPFPYNEKEVGIFICPSLPGWGFPVLVPISPYLNAFNDSRRRWKNASFVGAVWHELLHAYVAKIIGVRGYYFGALKKYSMESLFTKFHLHLYALQKAVLMAMEQADKWEEIVKANQTFGPDYARSVEIIEQDGYEPFLEELRAK